MAATFSATSTGPGKGEEFRPIAKTGLDGATLKRFTRLSPWRSTLALVRTFGAIAALVALPLLWPHPLAYAVAILGMVGQQHALAILAHEAVHYRLYGHRGLNDSVGRLCGYLVGVSMLTYRIVHRLHHNHLYQPADPDLPLQAGYPRGKAYLVKRLLKDMAGLTTIKNYAYFMGRPGPSIGSPRVGRKALDDTSPRLKAAARLDRRLTGGFALLLVAVAIATGWWLELLVLWVLPLLTLFQALLRFRAVAEHGAVPDESDVRRATRTTLAPLWLRWLLFPHSVNYHLEHHLYPSVPHYRLRQCHRALGEAGVLDGAEVVTLGRAMGKFFADPIAAG